MKRIITFLFATGLCAALATGCKEESTTYSDAEYVMFSDSVSLNMVLENQDYFTVPVSSTRACDYDRTFGVEVIDKGSTAIEGLHYRLLSNSVTIPAGKRSAEVRVRTYYNEFEPADTLQFNLRLVMPEQLDWSLYPGQSRVRMLKGCTFHAEEFTGWCVVTSTFLQSYPGVENTSIQRLIRTELDPKEPNTVILHSWLFTGYDIKLTFDPSDPSLPLVSMPEDQIMSDELSVFGQINGDNKILVTNSPSYYSFFDACTTNVKLWSHVYVKNLGTPVGTVGTFYNIMEWISDEEADRLELEEGMKKYE